MENNEEKKNAVEPASKQSAEESKPAAATADAGAVQTKAGEESGQKLSRPVKPKGRGKKRRGTTQVSSGRAYVHASYNNTIVTLTDQNGNVLSWSSAGAVGFKGPKKSTPYAAGIIVKDAVDKARTAGLKEVNVFVSGIGSGREAAVRALHANGVAVMTIKDITSIPHNGCRPPKPRRI